MGAPHIQVRPLEVVFPGLCCNPQWGCVDERTHVHTQTHAFALTHADLTQQWWWLQQWLINTHVFPWKKKRSTFWMYPWSSERLYQTLNIKCLQTFIKYMRKQLRLLNAHQIQLWKWKNRCIFYFLVKTWNRQSDILRFFVGILCRSRTVLLLLPIKYLNIFSQRHNYSHFLY